MKKLDKAYNKKLDKACFQHHMAYGNLWVSKMISINGI